MKMPDVPNTFIMALCLMIGGGAGWLIGTGDGKSAATESAKTIEFQPRRRAEVAERSSSITELRQEIVRSPASGIPKLVPRVLAIDDPLLRRRLIDDVILRLDESNWQEAVLGCYRFTAETGIHRHDEWRFMKNMAAERIGGPVLDFYLEKNNFSELHIAAWSWACRDPEAAKAWIDGIAATHPEQADQLTIQVLAGAARTDADRALELTRTLPPESMAGAVRPLLQNILQSQGRDALADWGERALEQLADDPGLRDEFSAGLVTKLTEVANHSSTSRAAAEQLVRIVDLSDVSPAAKLQDLSSAKGWAAIHAWAGIHRRHAGDAEAAGEILETGPQILSFSSEDISSWIKRWPDDPFVPYLEALSPGGGEIPDPD